MTILHRNPLLWCGSKARLMPSLLPLIPDHDTYVSVFGGSGADIARKPRSRNEVYNDLHGALTTFFRVLSDERQRRRLLSWLNYLVPSRVLFDELATVCREGHDDPVQVALALYYCSLWTYAGFDPASGKSRRFCTGRARPVPTRWLTSTQHLGAVAHRFRSVLIENRPWQAVIEKFDGPRSFFYCDPPYEPSTRAALNCYHHEMTTADHEVLLKGLQAVTGKVMLSGYDCDLYRQYLGAWRRVTFQARCTASRVHAARVETVWMNYDESGNRLETKKGAA